MIVIISLIVLIVCIYLVHHFYLQRIVNKEDLDCYLTAAFNDSPVPEKVIINNNECNNFNRISKLLKFDNSDCFYFCQILQRKKDGNDIKDSKLIKSYYFFSKKDFENSQQEIIDTCINYNARAYINTTARNIKEIIVLCIQEYTNILLNKSKFKLDIFNSCCAKYTSKKDTFLIDIDSKDVRITKIKQLIKECRGEGKVLSILNTPNGYHLVTSKFDKKQFNQKLVIHNIQNVEVKDNSFTLLYYKPNNLNSNESI